MGNSEPTQEEGELLKAWIDQVKAGEMAQVEDLIANCHISFQFAKTHSNYVKDWERTKKRMEENLAKGVLPPNTSATLFRGIINGTDDVMQQKLQAVQLAFQQKFGESIFNYLGPDGKVKKLFGIFG